MRFYLTFVDFYQLTLESTSRSYLKMGFVEFSVICGYLIDEKYLRALAGDKMWNKYKKLEGYEDDHDLFMELPDLINESTLAMSDLTVFAFPCCYARDGRKKRWILGTGIVTVHILKLQSIDYSKFIKNKSLVNTEIKQLKIPQPSGKIVYQLMPDDCYSCS